VIEHRLLADILLMRHLALGREAREHGIQPSLDRGRAQHRHEQPHTHERVAAEISVEAPGARQQLLAIGEERQRLAASRIRGGRIEQEIPAGERRERRLAGDPRYS
jgi:hypothetical protein